MSALQRHEGGVVVQPASLLAAERVKSGAIFRRRTPAKVIECFTQKRHLECAYRVVLDRRGGKRRGVVEVSGVEQAVPCQPG